MKKLMTLGLLAFAGALVAAETLVSPDGTLKVTVNGEGAPAWSLARKGVDLVLPSRLGLDFIGQKPWRGAGFLFPFAEENNERIFQLYNHQLDVLV